MNKVNKILTILVILLAVSCIIVFFSNTSDKSVPTTGNDTEIAPIGPTGTENKFTIGWSVYNSSYEYFKAMQDGVLAEADRHGINVITHDQKSSTKEMISGALHLIELGVDALMISPFDPTGMILITEAAKEKGIPVVVVDVGTGGTDVEAFILSDNFAGGILAGEYALRLIKEHSISSKNAAIIKVEETSIYARRRGEGFKRVLMDSNYNIIAEVTANSDTTQAYEAMNEILSTYKDDLAVVFCENDRMALGVAQAIDEAGKKGQIMVIGFDGDPAAVTAIKAGLMQGTIAQQPYEMGVLGVDVTDKILTGKRVSYDDPTKNELYMEVFLIDETGTSRK